MRGIFFASLIILALASSSESQPSEPVLARFVALDRFSGWGNPHEPRQLLVIEVQGTTTKLIRVIYTPKTDGFRGGAQFLAEPIVNYKNVWKMRLTKPSEKEKVICALDNFLRTSEGEIDVNEKNEPTLRFRSTQIDADVKFNHLLDTPCMMLDSFSKR